MYVYNVVLALHIDTTALSDGTYELIPESDGGDLEAQVNTAVLTEAPDQSSEEPRAEIVSNYREGVASGTWKTKKVLHISFRIRLLCELKMIPPSSMACTEDSRSGCL